MTVSLMQASTGSLVLGTKYHIYLGLIKDLYAGIYLRVFIILVTMTRKIDLNLFVRCRLQPSKRPTGVSI